MYVNVTNITSEIQMTKINLISIKMEKKIEDIM